MALMTWAGTRERYKRNKSHECQISAGIDIKSFLKISKEREQKKKAAESF